MITAIVTDPEGGFSYKGKRIAQDRTVRRKILGLAPKIYMSEYTASQYLEADRDHISITEHPPIDDEAVYYLEAGHIPENTHMLMIYRLDASYPSDTRIVPDPRDWELMDTEEFAGHSHKKVTLERYRRLR